MTYSELPVLFRCKGDELVGVISLPAREVHGTGVLIVVGGPQYRAGSHRMFTQLARYLAGHGVAAMRFDVRGMGDSTGDERPFDRNDADIGAAVDTFLENVPGLRSVLLWGLCDGASAACLYRPDDRISGAVLLNPWVRTAAGEAKTRFKHYYTRRLVHPGFWKRLVTGKVRVLASIRRVLGSAREVARGGEASHDQTLPGRMAWGLTVARRPFWLLLSTADAVALEFEGEALPSDVWRRACDDLLVESHRLVNGDHTLSSAPLLRQAMEHTLGAARAGDD